MARFVWLIALLGCICVSDAIPHDLRRQRLVALDDESSASPAEVVVILTAARSASTSLATDLANHSCSISFNEFFQYEPGMTSGLPESVDDSAVDVIFAMKPCQYVSGGCHGSVWRNRFYNMTGVLTEAREGFCSTHWSECGATCVVNIKVHGDSPPVSGVKDDSPLAAMRGPSRSVQDVMQETRSSLSELLCLPTTRSIVSERTDMVARECSLNYSLATGDYHSGTGGKDTADYKDEWEAAHCGTTASAGFVKLQEDWYDFARSTLAEQNVPYMEMPYEEYVADPDTAKDQLQSYAGLES